MDGKPAIGKRLREARKMLGLSQEKLGIMSGLDVSSASSRMNHYEKDRHFPPYTLIERIANVTNLPVSFFYEPDDEMANFIKMYFKLSDNGKRAVSNLLEEMVGDSSSHDT